VKRVRFRSPNAGVTALPYVLWGVQSGCFASHGLEISIESGTSDAFQKVASIVGGTVDIGIDGIVELVGIASGSTSELDLRLISNGYGFSTEQLEQAKTSQLLDGDLILETVLLGQPGSEWSGLSDLVGKSVAMNVSGNNAGGLRIALREAGISPKDVEFFDLGSSERAVAFERGDFDFVMLSGLEARKQLERGATIALYPGAFIYQPGPVLAFYTTEGVLQQKKDEIVAFQKAIAELNLWLSNPESVGVFREFIVEEFDYDPQTAEKFRIPNFTLGPPRDDLIEAYAEKLFENGLIDSPEVQGLSVFIP
jgi:ABC-type nitrate/sulfonate/bicarbonate transport system substrate-binding protein